jgi:predicted RNA binding protein YcfA (HicA-like mRNA interferase family)
MSAAHPPIRRLRNVSTRRMVRALERDGFSFVDRQGSQRVYHHQDGRFVVIHYHRASATLPPYVLRNFLIGTRWTEGDLKRLKLIK